jgi:hypothetical protein
MNVNCAGLRKLLHYILTAYIFFGWASPSYNGILIHMAVCIGILIHWYFNNGKCFLSEYDYSGENEYTIEVARQMGIPLQNYGTNVTTLVSYAFIVVPMLMGIARLYGRFIERK